MEAVLGTARRRPRLFLLAAAATGFAIGRVLRNGRAHDEGDAHQDDGPAAVSSTWRLSTPSRPGCGPATSTRSAPCPAQPSERGPSTVRRTRHR
jgi:uncharacterized protein YgiB involved in biofilm formation